MKELAKKYWRELTIAVLLLLLAVQSGSQSKRLEKSEREKETLSKQLVSMTTKVTDLERTKKTNREVVRIPREVAGVVAYEERVVETSDEGERQREAVAQQLTEAQARVVELEAKLVETKTASPRWNAGVSYALTSEIQVGAGVNFGPLSVSAWSPITSVRPSASAMLRF